MLPMLSFEPNVLTKHYEAIIFLKQLRCIIITTLMAIAVEHLCIQMVKASELCLVVFVLPNIKCQKEGKEFFDEAGLKVFI